MTRTIKKISPLGRIQVEEDTGYNNNPLLKTRLKEIQTITNSFRQTFEIEPEIEGGVGDGLDHESHVAETGHDVVALVPEMGLEGAHLFADFVRLEHGNRGFLEGYIGAAVEIGTAGADGFDEFLFTSN